jgi:hypothetical protein
MEFLMVAEDPQRQKEHVAEEKLFPTDAGTIKFHGVNPFVVRTARALGAVNQP